MSISLARWRRYLWLLAPFILVAAVACGGDDDESNATSAPAPPTAAAAATATPAPSTGGGGGGSKEIQFLFGIENSGIYTVVRDPAKERAKELGYTLLEGAANGDQQANVDALEAAVARGVAAIVVNPIGGGPLYEEAVKKAIDAGIPVFGYADTVKGETGLIGFDHGQGGRLLGEEAARWFKEQYTGDKSTFTWATFNFDQGGPSPTARMAEAEKAFVAATGIKKSRTAEAVSEEQGLNAAETFLQIDPGLDMILGVNDAGALGAEQAFLDQIAATGRDPGEIFLGGIDGQNEAIEQIALGGGPKGIYRASAALNMTEAGRSIVDIPVGVIERGEGGSILLNFAIFSPNDTAAATKFFKAIAGRDPEGTSAAVAPSTGGGSKEIQFLFGIENSGIYTVVRDPAKERAKELGYNLLEGAANGDQQANVDALEAAVARGVAAIVVNPIGGGPLYEEAVKKAIDAGIPVFGYADTVKGETGLIGFDHGQGGRLLGEEAARWFKEQYTGDKSTFTWATFNFDQGGPSPTARMAEAEKAFVAATGIEKSRTAEAVSEEQGLNAAETFLQIDPGLDMILGVNDAGALGAEQAFLDQIAATGRDPGEIFLGGIDGQNEAIEQIALGGGPKGIYRASAALNMTEAGRAIVDIPVAVIERGEGGSILLNFAIFSPNDTASATKFFKAIAGRDPQGASAAVAPSTGGGSKEIQFLFGVENSGIYTVVRDPAKERAKELGYNLLEGAANGDQQANVDALEAAVARGVAAIVVNPIGGGPLYEEVVKKATDAGIPVFGYADTIKGETGLIGFDHGQGGRLLGEEAARWFKEQYTGDKSTFTWATFNFDQGGPSPTARMAEFEKAFVAATGIEKSRTAEAVSEEQGLDAAQTFLQIDPGLDMIVGVNDAGALGAHQAFLGQIAATGRDPGEIFVGGIDGQNEALELIAAGGGPQGIYRASAALNLTEAGRAIVDIPVGVIERGEGGSILLNFAIFSPNDATRAQKFLDAISGK